MQNYAKMCFFLDPPCRLSWPFSRSPEKTVPETGIESSGRRLGVPFRGSLIFWQKRLVSEPRKGPQRPDKKCPEVPGLFLHYFALFCTILHYFALFCTILPSPKMHSAFLDLVIWLKKSPKSIQQNVPATDQRVSNQKSSCLHVLERIGIRNRIYAQNPAQRCGRHLRRCVFKPFYEQLEN